ncbi:hypothetical protein HCN44_000865, partial [Aphidius gifuensis]
PMDVYRNRRRGQRRRVRARPVIDFFQLTPQQFEKRFRLSHEDINMLVERIGEDLLHDDQRNEQIPPRTQILITLRFLASGAFYKVIGDFAGISKSTVWSIIHRVIHRIASLRDEYIHFPTTQQEIRQTQADFFVRFGFPRVVGCIDCKHIQIRSFGGPDAELFRNRDNYFSINTQVVCNAHLEITDIVARWPGSSHDSTIFHNSRLMANFEAANYQDGLLLGDAGYPSLPFLMTPVAQPNTPQEVLYNESQIRTRGHIERLFGIWARKWPFISGSRFKHRENTFAAIVALAVLHNIVRQRQLMWIGRVTGDNDILFDEYLLDNNILFLVHLSRSKVQSYRHTATFLCMKLATGLVDVCSNLTQILVKTNRQYDSEKKIFIHVMSFKIYV